MKILASSLFFLFSCIGFSQTYSFTHNSIVRSYIVHLPTGYVASTQYPLVINMHGYTSTAAQQQAYSQMDVVADTGKFIVVYPDGVNNAWNAGFGTNPTIDDVGFLSTLIDTMKAKFSVDALKVYSCGLSNGGFMSFRLACELENKIAAIAPVAGAGALTK
jgi:polyhydroxybutyrate depolymerase